MSLTVLVSLSLTNDKFTSFNDSEWPFIEVRKTEKQGSKLVKNKTYKHNTYFHLNRNFSAQLIAKMTEMEPKKIHDMQSCTMQKFNWFILHDRWKHAQDAIAQWSSKYFLLVWTLNYVWNLYKNSRCKILWTI